MPMRKLNNAVLATILILSPFLARSDAFNPKVNTVMYSENKKVKVFSKTGGRTYAIKNNTRLWTIGRYVKFGYVSSDGKYFVAEYGGGNLVPIDAADELELLIFYYYGKPIKAVRIKDIFKERSQLIKTASHLYWGNSIGFVSPNRFEVKRVDGKIFSFDLTNYHKTGSPKHVTEREIVLLIDGLTQNTLSQDAAITSLVVMGEAAVPYLVSHLGDMRPLATRQVTLPNNYPGAWEKFRMYEAEVVDDALSAVLDEITGEHFFPFRDGATLDQRLENRNRWVKWCLARYSQFGKICSGTGAVSANRTAPFAPSPDSLGKAVSFPVSTVPEDLQ